MEKIEKTPITPKSEFFQKKILCQSLLYRGAYIPWKFGSVRQVSSVSKTFIKVSLKRHILAPPRVKTLQLGP